MKSLSITLIFIFSCLFSYAQQDRFIYIQTENNEPFFVKFNDKIYTSSTSGYLIIPKLSQGIYSLVVGFAPTDAVQEFNCSINNKDIGYIIKSNAERRLQLLNVQSLNVIVPADIVNKPVIDYEKVSDPFSIMLANAVDDSTILRKDISQIVIEKVDPPIILDSAKTQIVSTEFVSVTTRVDSANDLATQKTIINDTVVISKDTITTVTTKPEIANTDAPPKLDTISVVIPAEIATVKSDPVTQKDSISVDVKDVVSTPPNIISDKASNQPDLIVANNLKSDSAQIIQVTNDVAAKSKKKKSKTKLKNIEKIEPDSTVISKTTIGIKKDSVFVPIVNSEQVVVKSTKKKSKLDNKAVEKKEVDITVSSKVTTLPPNDSKPVVATEKIDITKAATIKRKSRKSTKEGLEMTYVDDQVMFIDTIKLLIPVDQKKKADIAKTKSQVTTPVFLEDIPGIEVKNKSDKLAVNNENSNKESTSTPLIKANMVNSDCKSFATDDDFLKIRKKMVAEDKEQDMVKAARKYFKTKCFTTEQIKNLSVLFLKDEGRFMFFDAAYAFVSDSESYHILEKQLTELEYINRFKSMVKK